MNIYAISDLHLSFTADKPMNIFGGNWEGHFEKIKSDWLATVKEEDIVLIAGDISWAMSARAHVEGRSKELHEKCRPLVGGFNTCFPNALAVLGSPAPLLAGGGEVLGSDFASLLGLGVLDFVEFHSFYLLFFCTLIIAHWGWFVNPFIQIFLNLLSLVQDFFLALRYEQ